MLNMSVGQDRPVVKSGKAKTTPAALKQAAATAGLRFVGELVALFPETDPVRFMASFDLVALQLMQVKKLVLDRECPLPFPGTGPLEIVDWLRDHEITVVQEAFLGTRRAGQDRWYGKFRLILGQAALRQAQGAGR